MHGNNWNKFCKRITIKASPGVIYRAWTTQDGMEKWFLRKAEFSKPDKSKRGRTENFQKGDTYEWLWYGYCDDVSESRNIRQANGKDFLQFDFSGDCVVSVQIKEEAGETLVELTQENIPADENPETNLYVACNVGWTFYLANLKSVLEGGIDLRNKNVNLEKVINA